MQFANDLSLKHERIKRGKHKEDIYHIQYIAHYVIIIQNT